MKKKKAAPGEKKLSSTAENSVIEKLVATVERMPTPENIAAKRVKAVLPVSSKNKENLSKKDKPKKIKMTPHSFTLPIEDYAKLTELKEKCLKAGVQVKKTELMRAGLLSLSKLNKVALLKTLAQVEIIKKGARPKDDY